MMVIETVAFHGEPSLSRELSGLSSIKWSLDIRPLGVVRRYGRRHNGTQRRSRPLSIYKLIVSPVSASPYGR